MIRRLFTFAAMLAVLIAAGCDGPSANPKIQGDPPANPVKPLPLGNPPGGAPTPGSPGRPAIKPAG